MQQSVHTRKRPAPGASPLVQQPMPPNNNTYQYQQLPDNPDFTNFDFNDLTTDQAYSDPTANDANAYAATLNNAQPQTFGSNIAPAPSTDLVRRARNQQLATQNGQQAAWTGGKYGGMTANGNTSGTAGQEDEQDLEMKVALAKRDAQGKKKQIPPFVLKLSSFLDDNKNVDKIHWSDDGRAFIVEDEDEFARTLIPELFKHNNYASFVRQLNMYGFHKTVSIQDGSLRQSEKARKGQKPPSMYSHPYFRRNRPDLLWLIQKPTGKSNAKRKRDELKGEGFDSDDERQYSPGPEGRPAGELGAAGGQGLAQLPRSELTSVRQELKKLQQQQGLISRMIHQLKEQNEQFYRQATAFQALHDRHENSINAILTFLATFYNRSLEGHSGQNLVNMFSNQGQPTQQPQQYGSVVEEYNDGTPDVNAKEVQRYQKRPQLLLDAPEPQQAGGVATEPNSARQSVSPPHGDSPPLKRDSTSSGLSHRVSNANAQTTASPMVKDDAQTPNLLSSVPENQDMMSLINSVNATNAPSGENTPALDFSNLPNFQAAGGMTLKQRSDMLAMIHQNGGQANNNNALMSPTPPSMSHHMEGLERNNRQIQQLDELQKSQQSRIETLNDQMANLSPGGHFPPKDDSGFPWTNGNSAPDNFDMDEFLNDGGDFDFDFNTAAESTNPNFDWAGASTNGDDMFSGVDAKVDPDHLGAPGGTVESLSSEATSPAQTAAAPEEADGGVVEQDPGTPRKRLRTS